MNKSNVEIVAEKIRKGVLDINVQELFFSVLIKGLLYKLNKEIKIRGIYVPHMILHTGDDKMWIETKGYDASIEPLQISNEQNIYSVIPKCLVTTSNIDLDVSQLTSPYSIGNLQYCEDKDEETKGIYSLVGEFRRIPVKIGIELKYYTESFTDMLELIQSTIANLSFIRTFDIVYMGQKIKCSYKIPESFGEEHTMDIDGALQDNRNHSLSLSIEVESCLPVFNQKTIMPMSVISKPTGNIITKLN
jgi:hypothetical protein